MSCTGRVSLAAAAAAAGGAAVSPRPRAGVFCGVGPVSAPAGAPNGDGPRGTAGAGGEAGSGGSVREIMGLNSPLSSPPPPPPGARRRLLGGREA